MHATFYVTSLEFRKWLEKYHKKETELLVGFYKVNSAKASMTWSQSVDQALCFGWIDGIRKSIDSESYSIRFTPRRSTSIWSTVNIKKVDELTKSGLMTNAGLKAYSLRKDNKSNIYIHENPTATLDARYIDQFKANTTAWIFFDKQAPSYKKLMIGWIMNAKQEKTQVARLQKVIIASQQQERVR